MNDTLVLNLTNPERLPLEEIIAPRDLLGHIRSSQFRSFGSIDRIAATHR